MPTSLQPLKLKVLTVFILLLSLSSPLHCSQMLYNLSIFEYIPLEYETAHGEPRRDRSSPLTSDQQHLLRYSRSRHSPSNAACVHLQDHPTFKAAILEIHSGPGNAKLQSDLKFDRLSETFLKSGLEAIHKLKFPYFSRFPHHMLPPNTPNSDVVLMRHMFNARYVKIWFASPELVNDMHTTMEKCAAPPR